MEVTNLRPIDWEKTTSADKRYLPGIRRNSTLISVTAEVLVFSSISCGNNSHRAELDELYQRSHTCISIASDKLPVRAAHNRSIVHVGLNIYCRQCYGQAKKVYLAWLLDGRIRYGLKIEQTKRTKN